jgi:ribosome-binding protein aMBF1 (putative translation factor)
MNMTSTIAGSANLAEMAETEDQRPEEWISPIGQSITESIEEEERLDPEYKAERERNRPRRELSRMLMIRRIELDLSQQELADRMGTSVAVISRLERGSQNFSTATLQRLAQALDTRLVYAFEPVDDASFEYVDRLVVVP